MLQRSWPSWLKMSPTHWPKPVNTVRTRSPRLLLATASQLGWSRLRARLRSCADSRPDGIAPRSATQRAIDVLRISPGTLAEVRAERFATVLPRICSAEPPADRCRRRRLSRSFGYSCRAGPARLGRSRSLPSFVEDVHHALAEIGQASLTTRPPPRLRQLARKFCPSTNTCSQLPV